MENAKTHLLLANKCALLGFTIDPKLTLIVSAKSQAGSVNVLHRKLTKCVDKSFIMVFYYGLFHSHILYGFKLWGNATDACGKAHCKPILVLTAHRNTFLPV